MKIYVCSKKFFKEAVEVKKALVLAGQDLYKRIFEYEKQNIKFANIYNDDKVKYDQHGSDFFVYKTQKASMQLRILYSYFEHDGEKILLILDYFVKKKNNKNYLKLFDYANTIKALEIFDSSRCVLVGTIN